MYSYKFTVQHSTKLFEVSSIRLDSYSDSCDQRTSNLKKHWSHESEKVSKHLVYVKE